MTREIGGLLRWESRWDCKNRKTAGHLVPSKFNPVNYQLVEPGKLRSLGSLERLERQLSNCAKF